MKEYNTPIAKLGKRILMVKEADLPKIGTNEAMVVSVEQWDLETGRLEGEYKLEQLLKFNPWEDITDFSEMDEIRMELKKFREGGEQNREIKIR